MARLTSPDMSTHCCPSGLAVARPGEFLVVDLIGRVGRCHGSPEHAAVGFATAGCVDFGPRPDQSHPRKRGELDRIVPGVREAD